jgi:hypothetical protein
MLAFDARFRCSPLMLAFDGRFQMLSFQLFNAWELAEMEKDGCTTEEKRQTRSGGLVGWHQ